MGWGGGRGDSEATTKSKEAAAHPPHVSAPEKRNDSNHGNAENKAKYLYWSSDEANKLFGGNYNGTSDVHDILKERISILHQVNHSVDGYQLVIPITEDSSQCLSNNRIIKRRHKSCLLIWAYKTAIKKLQVGVYWIRDCFQPAAEDLNSLGITTAKTGRKIYQWNRDFWRDD